MMPSKVGPVMKGCLFEGGEGPRWFLPIKSFSPGSNDSMMPP